MASLSLIWIKRRNCTKNVRITSSQSRAAPPNCKRGPWRIKIFEKGRLKNYKSVGDRTFQGTASSGYSVPLSTQPTMLRSLKQLKIIFFFFFFKVFPVDKLRFCCFIVDDIFFLSLLSNFSLLKFLFFYRLSTCYKH